MGTVVVVEFGGYLIELVEDLVVTGHVRGQDASYNAFADALVDIGREGSEEICRWIFQDVERYRTVMILQRRNVIVAQGQLCPGVDLLHFTTVYCFCCSATCRYNTPTTTI